MQAEIFEGIMKAVWEHGPEVATLHPEHGLLYSGNTFDIAPLMGATRKSFPQAGIDVFLFPDNSGAICGTRGGSVIATFAREDHGDPEMDEEKMSWADDDLRPTERFARVVTDLETIREELPDGSPAIKVCDDLLAIINAQQVMRCVSSPRRKSPAGTTSKLHSCVPRTGPAGTASKSAIT